MTRIVPTLFLLTVLLCPQRASAALSPCDYPFTDPYEATLRGLPPAMEVELPVAAPTREVTLTVFPARQIPAVFWYEHGLVCSLAYQDHAAPIRLWLPATSAWW